jgi:hypothetical protein
MQSQLGDGLMVNRYDCLEDVLGSDHRPILLDASLTLKEISYLDSSRLLNVRFAKN